MWQANFVASVYDIETDLTFKLYSLFIRGLQCYFAYGFIPLIWNIVK